jgi:hypothetical protein
MKTIIVRRGSNGKFFVHLRGETLLRQFDLLSHAEVFAKELQTKQGGASKARIVRAEDTK